jgi:hypothetical protein
MYNCAPLDQRFSAPFCGPLTIKLTGLVAAPKRSLLIDIAPQLPQARMEMESNTSTIELKCDTLAIDSDKHTLVQIYRSAIITDPDPDPNGWVTLRDANTVTKNETSITKPILEQAS